MNAVSLQVADPVRSGRIALIAGNGRLPCLIAKALTEEGLEPFVVAIHGEAARELYSYRYEEISVVQLSKLIKILHKNKIQEVVLAGGVKRRPQLSEVSLDWITLKSLLKLFFALRKGDDALLRSFITVLEGYGFKVVGAQQLMPNLLAPLHKKLTHARFTLKDKQDLTVAIKASKALGVLDIGQAAVAIGGRVVALEGAEGTDMLLERVCALRAEGRLPRNKGGILVKSAKPHQELRVDLPTIGQNTVRKAFAAGLTGIAVEAEKSFILDFDKTIALANQYNIAITTFSMDDF